MKRNLKRSEMAGVIAFGLFLLAQPSTAQNLQRYVYGESVSRYGSLSFHSTYEEALSTHLKNRYPDAVLESVGASPTYTVWFIDNAFPSYNVASLEDLPDAVPNTAVSIPLSEVGYGYTWYHSDMYESRPVAFSYNNSGQTQRVEVNLALAILKCPVGHVIGGGLGNSCYVASSKNKISKKQSECSAYGDPIFPISGTTKQPIDLGLAVGGIPLVLTFDSSRSFAASEYFDAPSFGALWLSSLHRNLYVGPGFIMAYRGDGSMVTFNKVSGQYLTDGDLNIALSADAATGGYFLRNFDENALEVYDATGRLQSWHSASGSKVYFSYSDASTSAGIAPAPGYLINATDQDGRSTSISYMLPAGANPVTGGRVSAIVNANGESYGFSYDMKRNLSAVTWPDGAVRTLVYENPNLAWALTGVIDENGNRFSTFQYDADGLAISTELAGGVDRYSVSYAFKPKVVSTSSLNEATYVISTDRSWSAPVGTVVTTPNGNKISLQEQLVNGMPLIAGTSQPAGSGCSSANSISTFDQNGNTTSKLDFSGNKVCSSFDSLNRETVRVEGLNAAADCSVVLSADASVPANARKTIKQWHSDWNLTSSVTTQGTSKAYAIYNGQQDPFNEDAIASCTAAQLMQDGKPLPLLCKTVIQALTPSGSVDVTVPAASSSFTYDAAGRMLTSTDPYGAVETYTYHVMTSFSGTSPAMIGTTVGDRASFINAVGQITTYPLYDKLGRPRKIVDPRGVETDITYTSRGFLDSVSHAVAGQSRTTSYTYDAAGQKIGVVLPDGTSATFAYDAAHRLISVSDTRGNSINYTLDNQGNRISEQVRDPSGNLQRSVIRSFDALNRVQQIKR